MTSTVDLVAGMSAVRVQQRHIYNSSLAISIMAGVLIVATLAVGGSLAVAHHNLLELPETSGATPSGWFPNRMFS